MGVVLAAALLAGCFFEKPLTPGPSEALNTWFLGQWERKEPSGEVSRLVVSPAAGDIYRVQVSWAAKGKRSDYDFEAWASRVGASTFFTLHNLHNAPNLPEGAYLFLHPQMVDQNTLRVRGLTLDSPAGAAPLDLRKEIRARLKAGSLYSDSATQDWKRVGEVYWQRDGQTGVFTPVRYEIPEPVKKKP